MSGRLEQARKVAARPQLGDVELVGADPGVPLPVSVPVAVGQPGLSPLMQPRPHQVGHLRLHQLLGQQPYAVTQEVGIRALLRLVEQVQTVSS